MDYWSDEVFNVSNDSAEPRMAIIGQIPITLRLLKITPYIRLMVRLRPRTRTVEEVKMGLYGMVTGLPVHLTTHSFYDRTRIRASTYI
uniref:Uncharacterized protein n=1 Tax=Moniliophthora roreri TaxID=221103 RepID=A0A0W0EWD6_MONRR